MTERQFLDRNRNRFLGALTLAAAQKLASETLCVDAAEATLCAL
jgi:hypothetical protein